jgi:WD40 repeat protein
LPSDDVSVVFSEDDLELIAVGDDQVQRWDAASSTPVAVDRYPDLDWRATSSPDGSLVATADASHLVIREVASGRTLRELDAAEPLVSLAFSPDSRLVMAGIAEQNMTGPGNPGTQLWEVTSGREIAHHRRASFVGSIVFSADSRLVAAASGAEIKLYETAGGDELRTFEHRGMDTKGRSGTSLAFAASMPWLAAGLGSLVQVWDRSDGSEVARITGVDGVLAFTPDDTRLLTADGRSWEMNTAAQRRRRMSSSETLVQVALAGNLLATGSQPGGAKVWDLASGRLMATLPEGPHTTIRSLSPDGHYLATMSGVTLGSTWSMRLWRIADGRRIAEVSPGGQIELVTISPDSRVVAVTDKEKRITLFAADTGERQFATRIDDDIRGVAFASGGKSLALVGQSRAAWLWHPGSDPMTVQTAGQPVTAMAVTPDGRQIALALDQGSLLLVDSNSGTVASQSAFTPGATAVTFSADARYAAAATDVSVEVWDLVTSQRLPTVTIEQPAVGGATDQSAAEERGRSIADIAISGDGQWLALVSLLRPDWAYSVGIWHAPTGRPLATWIEGATDVALGSDGALIAALSGTGEVSAEPWQPQDLIDMICARISPELVAKTRRDGLLPESPPCRPLSPATLSDL